MAWDEYAAAARSARFCFAPYGHGWGMRLSEAAAFGCVPVIVQARGRGLPAARRCRARA
jgi:hypothetical protein